MGRGRAKAKQVKVARALRYSPGGDLDSLRRELGVDVSPAAPAEPEDTWGEAGSDGGGEPAA
ncbi:hypothetical protein Sme01_47630 [Sphaerisporangium melleum]|uniref:DUF3073 domain-containing protein n=1 Tax=Sphaerisporangium melleum TaxID=321316 RepID=A0A917VUH6_9ACTN|nr:DUF3073 family protein [Sphaerisporangium melleum]GGL18996.1 hypothetical protein GCM10007964_71240 [Sphaerisporangium melleum]GII72287.1 hypothetical protein Sme01_47630 [Sphaerisporangium melleum]